MNKSTAKSPFNVLHRVVPRFHIDLVPLPIDSEPAEFAEAFAQDMICMPMFNRKLHKVMKTRLLLLICIIGS